MNKVVSFHICLSNLVDEDLLTNVEIDVKVDSTTSLEELQKKADQILQDVYAKPTLCKVWTINAQEVTQEELDKIIKLNKEDEKVVRLVGYFYLGKKNKLPTNSVETGK